MMVLLWLAVPAVATIISIVWVHWSGRARGPIEVRDSLAEREKFKAAFATTNRPQRRAS